MTEVSSKMAPINGCRLKAFVCFGPDPIDVSGAALSQFRVRGGTPGPGGKPQGFALLVTPDVAPEEIDDIGGAWFVCGSSQAVELVGKFFWYLDDAWHGFLR